MARPATGKTKKQLTLTVKHETHDILRNYSSLSGKSISETLDNFAEALAKLDGIDKLQKLSEYQDFTKTLLTQRNALEAQAIELISQCRFEEAEEVLKRL